MGMKIAARHVMFSAVAATCCTLLAGRADAGTWTQLSNINPFGDGQEILLSDGSVLFDNASIASAILHPDATGNYANGTWTPVTPGNWYALYSPDAVLNDGTWMKYGGEYNPGNESASEIYNPATGAWRIGISPISSNVYDTFNTVLANGMVLNNSLYGPAQTEIYNWQTCSWSAVATAPNWGDEANVELLPNGDVFDPLWLQQYSPSLDKWINLPGGPISDLGDPGPAIQLYNGQVLVENTQNQMEFYIPSKTPGVAGTWSPNVVTLPGSELLGDYQSSIEPNGNVIIGADGDIYELNPTTNAITLSATGIYGLYGDVLTLPNGQVIVNGGGNNTWIYTPTGTPATAWRPTVTSVAGTGPFTLTGTQLFGLSQCGSDSDDRNTSENYPIVYLKKGSNVWYCRSYGYSTRTIAPGTTPETCQFSLPTGLAAGAYSLYVSVNGISSATAYNFTAPATPAVYVSTGNQYVLRPSSSAGTVLNSNNGGKVAGTNPIDSTGALNSDDDWTFVQNSNGTYTITGDGGLVLDSNGAVSPGGPVVEAKSGGTTRQEWNLTLVAGGYYKITNSYSGLALDAGTSPANLKVVVTDAYTGAAGQNWALSLAATPPTLLPNQQYIFTPVSNGTAAMNSYNGGGTPGTNPIDCTNPVNNDDYFTVTLNANKTYTITDDSGLVLDNNGLAAPGGPVIENTNLGNSHQQWNITFLGNGLYKIINASSGLALDAGTNPVNIQTIVTSPYTGAGGQRWHLFNGSLNGFIVTYQPGMIPDWNAGATGIPQQVDLCLSGKISFPVSVLANTANGGSVGTVTFSASGLPPGMIASFSPASITGAGTTTCTLTAGNAVKTTMPGSAYTIDIMGTGGGTSAGVVEGQDMHVNVTGTSLANGTYSMVNQGQADWSGWPAYIDLDYDNNNSGIPVTVREAYDWPNQQWTVTQRGSFYSIISVVNGQALTASSATSVVESPYTGAAAQLWKISPSGVGFLVTNDAYGKVLDAPTNQIDVAVALDPPSGVSSQSWIFTSNNND